MAKEGRKPSTKTFSWGAKRVPQGQEIQQQVIY